MNLEPHQTTGPVAESDPAYVGFTGQYQAPCVCRSASLRLMTVMSPFKGWTRADGVRESFAPDPWPFGRRNVEAEKQRASAVATNNLLKARAIFLENQREKKCDRVGS